MRCEVCGRQIRGKSRKVIIEGAKMIACEECARLGSVYLEPQVRSLKTSYIPAKRLQPISTKVLSTKRRSIKLREELELIERFGSLVRRARQGMGLSHKDLGRKIGEKVSVLKKVESEKMIPDQKLARKLEHMLKVKILVPVVEPKISGEVSIPPSSGLTLGEIAHLKTEKRRHRRNEGSNSSSKAPL